MYYAEKEIGGDGYEWSVRFKVGSTSQFICACDDKDTAEMICDALNHSER